MELIKNAQKLGIDTTDKTKSKLVEAIAEKTSSESEAEEQDNDGVDSNAGTIDMPKASKGKTTSEIATKTESKLKATTRPSDIVKIRQGRKSKEGSSEYPKHLPHNIIQPGPHGLSTGG